MALARNNPREIKRLLNSALLLGRGAADFTPAKEPADGEGRRLRFAQGVQLYLLQRLVQDRISESHDLLLGVENLRWFEKLSAFARKFPDAEPQIEDFAVFQPSRGPDPDDARLPGRRQSQFTGEKFSGFGPLFHARPRNSTGDSIDPSFLADKTLWLLMRVPFSAEVAEFAPRTTPVPVLPSKPQTKVTAQPATPVAMANLTLLIRDRLAKELGVPVAEFDSVDFNSIRELNLQSSAATDKDLKGLTALTSLQSLNLGDTQITDTGLKELAKLTSLQSLDMFGTEVTDTGLKQLAKLTSLRHLDLRTNKITYAAFKELAKLTSLHSLCLSGSNVAGVADAALKELTKLPSLRSLRLWSMNVTDVGLKELTKLTFLESLDLFNTEVTDTMLKNLTKLTALVHLGLGDTKVTDAGLKELNKLNSLQSLDLENTEITDAGLKELAKLTSLQSLDLGHTQVTDAGLKELAKLSFLRWLYLSNTKVTEAGFSQLKKTMPNVSVSS